MNGFTTTETDATDTGVAGLVCERLEMAMAEAGWPLPVWFDGTHPRLHMSDGSNEPTLRAWRKACSLVGLPVRCLPCLLASECDARVSPDCEGTGRCAQGDES